MAALKIHEASSSRPGDYTYDVFLSFRGEDTRFNFVGHLYRALTQRGIETFLDEKSLQRGKSISPDIKKSIQSSRFAIVVFSKNYANSTWCLEELVEIIHCMEAKSITVLPIFHGANPSDVCNQTGTFVLNSESFKEDERDQVPIWRSVLTKAGNLSGWDDHNKDEASVIEEVVMHVLTRLSHIFLNVASGLVGMESCMKKMKSLLEVGFNDVRMIGICGMGGIGKTTIAEQIYRGVASKFDGCCFLERVREAMKNPDGRKSLQKQLLSAVLGLKPWDHMKPIDLAMRSKCVLIVLDDVEDIQHLEALAGKHDWFGSGSRIIITSRNKRLLEAYGVDKVYEVEPLTDLDSLKLFKHHAFKASDETDILAALSQHFVNYAKGLPLAVKVLGSCLTKKTVREWKDELDKLKVYPPEEVQSALRVSFQGLNPIEQKIFLDIAIFFNGDHVDKVTSFLESSGLFPISGLSSLQGKCLVTVIDNKILMHDLLQEMGRKIVLEESEDPGKRSRLWDHKDVNDVLAENKGTEKIEGMVLDLSKINDVSFKFEAFSRMTKLRLLKIFYFHLPTVYENPFSKDLYLRFNPSDWMEAFDLPQFPNVLMVKFVPPILRNVRLLGEWIIFSNELRYLHWHGYPLKYLPINFYPQNLVELYMPYSRITKFWTQEKRFDRLKIINLCNSKELIETPNFTCIPNLEILILKGCTSLKEVHPSVGLLKNLLLLNLEDCDSLQKFPSAIDMKSLEVFLLSGCVKFVLFPNIQGKMEKLAVLHLDGTAIEKLPVSIGLLTGLEVLCARSCKRLKRIPRSISQLKALRIFNVSGCSNLKELPRDLGLLENLEELRLDETGVAKPPTSIGCLRKLKILSFYGCPSHEEFPRCSRLRTPLCLRSSIFLHLKSLTSLDLSYCNLGSHSIPDTFSFLLSLRRLTFSFLPSLRRLNLSGNFFKYLPYSVYNLPNLEVLHLSHCPNLVIVRALPPSIYYVDASNCDVLSKVEYPQSVNGLCMRSFNFMNCKLLDQDIKFVEDHIRKISMQSFAEFSIIIPGSGIPMWSEHESRGLSATMKLPGDWYNRTFKGLALWAVFEVRELPLSYLNQQTPQNHRLDFDLKCNKQSVIADNGFHISRGAYVASDHVWLRYFSSPTFKMTLFKKGWSEIDAFITANEQGLVVKKCGLYPLCWDEVKDRPIYIHPHFGESAASKPSSGQGSK